MTHTGSSNRKLRVAIDCRINDFRQGIGTAVQALARALSDSTTESQEYSFLVREGMRDRMEPYVYGPCTLEVVPETRLEGVKAALRWITPLRLAWKKIRGSSVRIAASDGYLESRRFDVVHFPTQVAYLTKVPSIYQPWDLQHLHYPKFFSAEEFARREAEYRTFCDQASYVCVQTEWTRRDVIQQYGLPKAKLEVIPWGAVFDAYREPTEEQCRETLKKYKLPRQFFFYPAVTWPHKNHEVILRALELVKKDRGAPPQVFFTGASTEHREVLEKLARELDVAESVHYLGFIAPMELQAIFKVATAMVFPSRFEGFGLPILEAFHSRLPVLASSATTLPEVAGDGALYFDPDSPSELAELMKAMLDFPEQRADLIDKGSRVLSGYSMDQTAASFQELYARTASPALQEHRAPEQPQQSIGE
jgi:glycosyltransferase involved in cell wall biosynthesis